MPTENKTTNLGLNSWLGTDKPKRADFVEDNMILDERIGNHINNTVAHLSSADRKLLGTLPIEVNFYVGNGAAQRTYTFNFTPILIFVFLSKAPFVEYDATNGYIKCNSAVLANGYSSTAGASLIGDDLVLEQSTSAKNGRFMNLNKSGSQYFYIAFK